MNEQDNKVRGRKSHYTKEERRHLLCDVLFGDRDWSIVKLSKELDAQFQRLEMT